jgi:hypothetical protein
MSLELGLQLAEAHFITRWQLENALQAQLIYHGPLLTNLIKLGYLIEEDAISFCSRQYNIQTVRESVIQKIPERIIRMIPKDFVFAWRMLPVGVRDSALLVASHIPIPNDILDELSFLTGLQTRALLCTERLLIRSIRYYYTISLPSWTIDERVAGQFSEPEPLDGDDATTPPSFEPPLTDTVPPSEFQPHGFSDTTPPIQEEVIISGDANELEVSSVVYEAEATALAEKASKDIEHAVALIALDEDASPKMPTQPDVDLNAFEDLMALAESRDEIIEAVCGWFARWGAISAFFSAKQDALVGFYVKNPRQDVDVKSLSVPIESPIALARVAITDNCIVVDIPGDEGLQDVAESLGLVKPRRGLAMPVHLRGKMVGVVLALCEKGGCLPSEDTELLDRVRRIVSDSLETLILSKKIGV